MGNLVLSCKGGEEIQLTIDLGVDTGKLLRRLLIDGITIRVSALSDKCGLASKRHKR